MRKPLNADLGMQIFAPDTCTRPVGQIRGAGVPGGDSGLQDLAGLGMLYTNEVNGDLYRKISIANDSAADWQIVGSDQGAQATGVTTAATVDCINVDAIKAAEWEVSVEDQDNPENSTKFKVFAGHNGTAAADATSADFTKFAELCFGAEFNYSIDVVLSGAGAAQEMCLQVASTLTNGVDVIVRRTDIK